MKYQAYDKYEYNYVELYNSIQTTLRSLNLLGQEGWELIELIKPKSSGDIHKAWMKRKITEVEI